MNNKPAKGEKVSACCGAKVTRFGDDRFYWYTCLACMAACQTVEPPEQEVCIHLGNKCSSKNCCEGCSDFEPPKPKEQPKSCDGEIEKVLRQIENGGIDMHISCEYADIKKYRKELDKLYKRKYLDRARVEGILYPYLVEGDGTEETLTTADIQQRFKKIVDSICGGKNEDNTRIQ